MRSPSFWVPGSFEIPLAADRLIARGGVDASSAWVRSFRGATSHFDYVAGEAAKGIAQVGLKTGVPMLFGVLTTDTLEQALERAGSKAGNKGWGGSAGRHRDGQCVPPLGPASELASHAESPPRT